MCMYIYIYVPTKLLARYPEWPLKRAAWLVGTERHE